MPCQLLKYGGAAVELRVGVVDGRCYHVANELCRQDGAHEGDDVVELSSLPSTGAEREGGQTSFVVGAATTLCTY